MTKDQDVGTMMRDDEQRSQPDVPPELEASLTVPPLPISSHQSPIISYRPARVRVSRIAYGSLAKFGCLLGGLAMILPGLVCGVGTLTLVRVLRVWLESWQQFSLTVLGQTLGSLDLINALRLTAVLDRLRVLDQTSPLAVIGITLAVSLFGGLLLALVVVLVGLGYNVLAWLTGGITMELEGEMSTEPPTGG